MKKYNIINNTLGWLVFLVAAATYMLTIEPTASFWDCPEFISQGYKLEIGHPPGNPMFILAARFAANFAGGDVMAVAKCVNAMSAILSAATILLLFWTITHLVKKLVVKSDDEKISLAKYLVIMGSGICGALAYAWSDTFWFSAEEAEVYAFSSFCTALVFWLILKWENRASNPTSDRYLILIAYVFGVSLGVHLLNLLAIPAIALIFYYRNTKESTAKGSIITLLISFVVIVLILYGLEPGFIEMSGYFERFFVNTFHMSYNSGVLIYALLLLGVMAWSLYELHRNKSDMLKKMSVFLSIVLSGMLMLTNTIIIPLLLIIALAVYLFGFAKKFSPRLYSNIILCMMMIFIGFSSYALVLIRSNANLPLDENSPNSPFALTSYLSRDQYGKSPLIYGYTLNSPVVRNSEGSLVAEEGPNKYFRVVKTEEGQPNEYVDMGPSETPKYAPETEMLFPRIHSAAHAADYASLLGETEVGRPVEATISETGETTIVNKPTFVENLTFFFSYQLNYMYWRYFMWNFAGRQNDFQSNGPGDFTRGNWISGIPFIDNPRLGDQNFLPDDYGKGNKGHNMFFMLPLLLGIIGLLWQAFSGKRGIEQFWVVFFLFFMTGIAIVMYLNQTPGQPRERDYAYAGSFYAYAIWIGMGVAALWSIAMHFLGNKDKEDPQSTPKPSTDSEATQMMGVTEQAPVKSNNAISVLIAAVAAIIGIAVPLQMVSQTWDDHDRSGRYCARDFGENYLQSVDKDAIIFCNGDNDTFPLWYLQEVEGVRTDVRAVNLSYLATDWYIAQMQRAAYDSKPLPMFADPLTYAYEKRQYGYFLPGYSSDSPVSADEFFKNYYNDETYENNSFKVPAFSNGKVYIPANVDAAIKAGVIPESMRSNTRDSIIIDLKAAAGSGMSASQTMIIDLIANSIAGGWKRPVYFATTIPESLFMGFSPYMLNTGMAYQITPVYTADGDRQEKLCNTDKMYDVVTKKFKWGGLDKAKPGSLYLDETVSRMVITTRSQMCYLADALIAEGDSATNGGDNARAADRYKKAEEVLDLMGKKLPTSVCPYQGGLSLYVAQAYSAIAKNGKSTTAGKKAADLIEKEITRYAQYAIYYESLVESGLDEHLSSGDQSIITYMIPGLFDVYREVNPNGLDALINKFRNVSMSGRKLSESTVKELTMSREKRAQQMMQQQVEARAQAQAEQIQMSEEAGDQQSLFDSSMFK